MVARHLWHTNSFTCWCMTIQPSPSLFCCSSTQVLVTTDRTNFEIMRSGWHLRIFWAWQSPKYRPGHEACAQRVLDFHANGLPATVSACRASCMWPYKCPTNVARYVDGHSASCTAVTRSWQGNSKHPYISLIWTLEQHFIYFFW